MNAIQWENEDIPSFTIEENTPPQSLREISWVKEIDANVQTKKDKKDS